MTPMTNPGLVRLRLVAQGLSGPHHGSPAEVVGSQLAMQAQDLPGVIASIALRLDGEPDIQPVLDAFTRGDIVRGYPMRGTVFTVLAEDLAWMTELCAGGSVRSASKRRSQLGLDESHVRKVRELLDELWSQRGDRPGIARSDLFAAWETAGVPTDKGRGYHLLVHLIATVARSQWSPIWSWTGTRRQTSQRNIPPTSGVCFPPLTCRSPAQILTPLPPKLGTAAVTPETWAPSYTRVDSKPGSVDMWLEWDEAGTGHSPRKMPADWGIENEFNVFMVWVTRMETAGWTCSPPPPTAPCGSTQPQALAGKPQYRCTLLLEEPTGTPDRQRGQPSTQAHEEHSDFIVQSGPGSPPESLSTKTPRSASQRP